MISSSSAPTRVTVLLLAAAALLFAVPTAIAGNDRGLDPWAYNAISEHSAGQGLDRWAFNAIHPSTSVALSEHSVGQDPNRSAIASTLSQEPTRTTAAGFQWGDAGVGAGVTLALLAALTGGIVLLRRHRILVRAHA